MTEIDENNVSIQIPKFYLLTIAAYGNMGDGELPDIMRKWAERSCLELGLGDQFRIMQQEKISEMRLRLKNVLGEEFVSEIDGMIGKIAEKLSDD